MNCQIFETVVNDLARDQMMEANALKQALAHSVDCEACALRLAVERRLTLGLQALAEEMKSLSASPRVEQDLLEAFRAQTSFPGTRSTNRRRYRLGAAAAVVLLALGIAGMRWVLNGPSLTTIKTSDNTKTKTSEVVAVNIEDSKTKPTPEATPWVNRPRQSVRRSIRSSSSVNKKFVARRTNNREAADSEQNEITTEFLPLSYVSAASLQDGGELVRVELPRSAMARFGLPVNMERYGERVKADVLVSADGMARAIRFIQ